MAGIYYQPPSQESFDDMKKACTEVWGEYKDSPGGYMEEKLSQIRDIKNVGDNFMYMLAMFDMTNQWSVVQKLSQSTKDELTARLVDGGNTSGYLIAIGLS
jgi:hypothetical protein